MKTSSAENLLRSKSLKATSTRVELVKRLSAFASAMPYSAIQEQMKDIDRVTLYRTIKSLTDQGVIHMAYQENNEKYYALCGTGCQQHDHHHDHIHFKCTECLTVTCEQPTTPIAISIAGHHIQHLSINAEGICPTCASQSENN